MSDKSITLNLDEWRLFHGSRLHGDVLIFHRHNATVGDFDAELTLARSVAGPPPSTMEDALRPLVITHHETPFGAEPGANE